MKACVLGLLVFAAAKLAAAEAPKPSISALTWLAGTWSFERGGRETTEHWLEPAGGTMLGVSRTVTNGKTVEHEFILLREDANGEIVYEAKPSGQAGAAFKLVRLTEREAVFENPAHDFPQRISYLLKSDGTLLAAIEGMTKGKTRRVEFPYRRVAPR